LCSNQKKAAKTGHNKIRDPTLTYHKDLDLELYDWVICSIDLGLQITREHIRQKARELIQPHNPSFKGTDSWLACFLSTHFLRLRSSMRNVRCSKLKLMKFVINLLPYFQDLKDDEMFFIFSCFQSDEVSILFSTRALINNLIKQSQLQPSFIHIDGPFKLIDLGFPITLSTETVSHNFRPIAFLIA